MEVPCLIGERLNFTGSAAFAQAFLDHEWSAIEQMAAQQVDAGASVLDVCLSGCGRGEAQATVEFYNYCQIGAPVFIDSMNPEVMEAAVQVFPSVAAFNSANLARGAAKFQLVCELAAHYKVSVVAACIDEDGIATTAAAKLRIAERLLELASAILPLDRIILDLLALPLRTLPNSGAESLTAVREMARSFPEVRTLLAISNVSYSLAPRARAACERDFLERALGAGLSCAIANTARCKGLIGKATHYI